MLSIVISLLALLSTIYFSRLNIKNVQENQKNKFIMELISSHIKMIESKQSDVESIIVELNEEFLQKKLEFRKVVLEFQNYFRGKTKDLENEILKIYNSGIVGKEKESFVGKEKEAMRRLKNIHNLETDDVERILISYFECNRTTHHIYKKLPESVKVKKIHENITQKLCKDTDFFNYIDQFIVLYEQEQEYQELDYKEINAACNKIFNRNYGALGHFFRNSYRVVKVIKEYYPVDPSNKKYKKNKRLQKSYLGILRSLYSEDMLLAIYYNSTYTDKGIGYAYQLQGSDFFGDLKDLEGDNPIHFRNENLVFSKKDLKIMKNIYVESENFKYIDQFSDLKEEIQKKYDNA